jgi:hypothetical protein
VNQKKCPKCGEMNPAEAVMCWACYAPLSGSAVAGGGTAVASPQVASHREERGKKAIPVWQLGVLGGGLLLALGFGAMQMMGGPSDPEVLVPNVTVEGGTYSGSGGPSTAPGANNAPPPITSLETGGAPITIEPKPAPYVMVSPPNPDTASKWGVMAIVPTQDAAPQRAAQLASFAGRQYRGGQWGGLHIYVFRDRQSAQAFADYQVDRRSEVLGQSDYTALANLWPNCLARYEMKNGRESVKFPSRTPNSWWYSTR